MSEVINLGGVKKSKNEEIAKQIADATIRGLVETIVELTGARPGEAVVDLLAVVHGSTMATLKMALR
jgi:hypothetical protein